MTQRLVIASDHGGFELKEFIKQKLELSGLSISDLGCFNQHSVDYTDYAHLLAQDVLSNKETMGILICGTGLGVSITANRHPGIRAALCTDTYTARMAREHNDANVLCMGARVLGHGLAGDIVDVFMNAHFKGGRHLPRINKIDIQSNQ